MGVARRTRQRISAVMKAAIAAGHRPDNPAADPLTCALPKGGQVQKHQRALLTAKSTRISPRCPSWFVNWAFRPSPTGSDLASVTDAVTQVSPGALAEAALTHTIRKRPKRPTPERISLSGVAP